MNAMTHNNLGPNLNSVFGDQYGREKRKLRISVTDRCNFKCIYCMPDHPEWMKKHDLLSFEDLYQFCDFMVRRGIEHIRITGGEPLMRQGVVHFIEDLQQLRTLGLKKISMTSNAHYLEKYALSLKKAGLDDLNISLDSLNAEQFQQLTQKQLQPVLEGIQAAQAVGLPIKINAVLLKDINDDQIIPLAKWSIHHNIVLRFIEFMPLDGDSHWSAAQVVTEQYILAQLKQHFHIETQTTTNANPARQYFIDGHPIGIISTISNSFCSRCDRLRLTAKGEFFNCLFAEKGLDLKSQIQALSDSKLSSSVQLNQSLSQYIWNKKKGFHEIQQLRWAENKLHDAVPQDRSSRKISMYMIGG